MGKRKSSYERWKERQKNASPYANQAVCSKCRNCEWVRVHACCSGFGKATRLPSDAYWSQKPGYCTQFYPKGNTEGLGFIIGKGDTTNE